MINQEYKPRLLAVDDEEGALLAIKFTLSGIYDVVTSRSQEDTLNKLRENSFDLVLLDIFFEKENKGLELLQIIVSQHPDLPVIMFSGSMEWARRWNELKEMGARGFLHKPFDRNEIKPLIDKVIQKSKAG